MELTTVPTTPTLSEMLGVRARSASPRRLAIDVAAGFAVAAGAYWLQPWGWLVLFCAGTSVFAYGCWAFAERHLEAAEFEMPSRMNALWRGGRTVAAALGVGSVVFLLFAALGVALGVMQS